MDIPTQAELLDRIETFRERHSIAESRFGRDAVNNPALIRNLRDGKSPTLDTLNRLVAYMTRIDGEAKVRAKLTAPPPERTTEEEVPLPFGKAPVSPTGGSSPISSSTTGHPTSSEATASSRSTASDTSAADPRAQSPSCSADAKVLP